MSARRTIRLAELVVLLMVAVFSIAFFSAYSTRMRENANRTRCADNLRSLGQAILEYSNENKGQFPRTLTADGDDAPVTWGTGVTASNPFAEDGPKANDISAALFLLVREKYLKP